MKSSTEQRPASPYQAIANSLQHVIDEYELHDPQKILEACLQLGQHVILPLVLSVVGLVMTYKAVKAIERLIFPPPPRIRYQEALEQYQKGQVRPALKALDKLQRQDKFAKAALSLAVHELYVAGDAAAALRILREAKTTHGIVLKSKSVTYMQEDAKAIQDGNSQMIKMNARMAKQEYLGIV